MMPLLPPGWEWDGRQPVQSATGDRFELDGDDGRARTFTEIAAEVWKRWEDESGITKSELDQMESDMEELERLRRAVEPPKKVRDSRIARLTRRAEYIEKRIEDGQGNTNMQKAEASALRWVIRQANEAEFTSVCMQNIKEAAGLDDNTPPEMFAEFIAEKLSAGGGVEAASYFAGYIIGMDAASDSMKADAKAFINGGVLTKRGNN